jgi:hypothetical protein
MPFRRVKGCGGVLLGQDSRPSLSSTPRIRYAMSPSWVAAAADCLSSITFTKAVFVRITSSSISSVCETAL